MAISFFGTFRESQLIHPTNILAMSSLPSWVISLIYHICWKKTRKKWCLGCGNPVVTTHFNWLCRGERFSQENYPCSVFTSNGIPTRKGINHQYHFWHSWQSRSTRPRVSTMQKTGWTNYFSFMVWSGLEKLYYLWLWSIGHSKQPLAWWWRPNEKTTG